MRYAAIDIGSNAVRLLIANIIEAEDGYYYKKDTLIRIPLRLGDDAFLNQKLSEKKIKELSQSMLAFRNLMDVFKVSEYKAFATSAMREAKNGPEVISRIKKEANIKIEIITGDVEAKMIYSSHIEETLDHKKNYLYIDVGGGSTELSIFSKNKVVASQSFNIGTIRILDNKDTESEWARMRDWIKEYTKTLKPMFGIGTGGNINKLHRLSGEKDETPLSFGKIKSLYNYLNSYSLKERIQILELNQDRADVIIPAAEIYLSVMKWAGVKSVHVPKVGLVDGIIVHLMENSL
jgi:exopolyphosphatase / guanosine-5'-triphosphate,3'-diphosphate pyrophosphatase